MSDYLNFAIKDKKLSLPNHHYDNKFYDHDFDDLLVEELMMRASAHDSDEIMLEENLQLSTEMDSVLDDLSSTPNRPNRLFMDDSENDSSVTPNSPISRSSVFKPNKIYSIHRDMLDSSRCNKSLDEVVAKMLLDVVLRRIMYGVDVFEQLSEEPNLTRTGLLHEDRIKYLCRQIVFKLSLTNPDVVSHKLVTEAIGSEHETSLTQNKLTYDTQQQMQNVSSMNRVSAATFTEAHLMKQFKCIECCNFTLQSLTSLLNVLANSKLFIKNYNMDLADSTRIAVWNWIMNYSKEFADMYRALSGPSVLLAKAAGDLLEVLSNQVKSKKDRRPIYYPLMSMLCVLIPDKFTTAVNNLIKNDSKDSVSTLIKEILKNVKGKDKSLLNLSVQCFTDLYRVSNFISVKSTAPCLLAPQIEDVLKENLISPQLFSDKKEALLPGTFSGNAIGAGDDQEVSLVANFIVACYLRNPSQSIIKVFSTMCDGVMEQKLSLVKALLSLDNDPFPPASDARDPNTKRLATSYSVICDSLKQMFKEACASFEKLEQCSEEEGKELGDDVLHALIGSGLMKDTSSLLLLQQNFVGTKDVKRSGNLFKKGNEKENEAMVKKERSAKILFELMSTLLYLFGGDPALFLDTTSSLQKGRTNHVMVNEASMSAMADVFITTKHPVLSQQTSRLFEKLYLDKYLLLWRPKHEATATDQVMTYTKITTNVLDKLSSALIQFSDDHTVKSILSLLRYITYCGKMYYMRHQKDLTPDVTNARWRTNIIERLASNLLVCLCSSSHIWSLTTLCLRDLCDQIEIMQNQDSKYLNYLFYRQLTNVNVMGANDGIQVDKERHAQIQLFRRVEIQTKTNLAAFDEVYGRWKVALQEFTRANANSNQTNNVRDLFNNYTAFMCALGGVCLHDNDNKTLDDFLDQLINQIVNENILIQFIVRGSIADDLAPALYDRLFRHMLKALKTSQDGVISANARNDTFVEHFIEIISRIVNSKDATFDLALASEFDTLVSVLFRYFANNKQAVNFKIKLCQLVESVIDKSEYITFKDEHTFRTGVIEDLSTWCKSGDEQLEMASVKALSQVLDNYQINNERSEQYAKYFVLLRDGLVTRKAPQESAVLALSRLLNCNVSLGLEHFMDMVYSQDEYIRSIFINLIATLLKKGGLGLAVQESEEQGDDNSGAVAECAVDPYVDMTRRLLFGYDYSLIFALFSQTKNPEKDELCEAIVRIFMKVGGSKELLNLLQKSVTLEVSTTEHPETLFRANSAASKLMKSYCTRTCQGLMQSTMGALIDEMNANPTKFEIDPEKAAPRGEDAAANQENVLKVTQNFIDAIVNSTNVTPPSYIKYCQYLSRHVGDKFPGKSKDDSDDEFTFEYKNIAVGGFMFLRLFCPAITSPQLYGLEQLNSNDSRRFGIIITKILQNIANGVYKSQKEAFMAPFEDMIKNSMRSVKLYFDDMVDNNPCGEFPDESDLVSPSELEAAFGVVHRYLQNYSEGLRAFLQKNNAYDEFTKVLTALGQAPEVTKKAASAAAARKKQTVGEEEYSSAIYKEFMTKMSSKQLVANSWHARRLFFQSDVSAAAAAKNDRNQHVVYFVPHRLLNTKNNVASDWELITYVIYTTMEKVFREPYALVMDCTNWKPFQSIPLNVLLRLIKMYPTGAKKNLREVFVINANQTFKDCTKHLSNLGNVDKIKWQFLDSTMTDLHVRLGLPSPQPLQHLACSDIKWERDNKSITSLQCITPDNKSMEIKISSDKLYLIYPSDRFLNKYDGVRVECIALSDIISVEPKRTLLNVSKRDYVIKYYVDDKMDPDRELHAIVRSNSQNQDVEIINQLRRINSTQSAHASLSASSSPSPSSPSPSSSSNTVVKKRKLKISDVPGQLLSISFLNLESQNPQTRLSAYNLLTSIIVAFQLPITNMIESENLSVPRNTEDLVLELSEKMAVHKADLTIEFMTEALKAFSRIEPKSQIMCAKILKPWIKNLTLYSDVQNGSSADKKKMLHDWFEMLTRVSCQHSQVFPALAEIWTLVSNEQENMLYLGLDSAIHYGLEIGIYGDQQMVGDLIITLASHCPKEANVAMRIIQKILHLLHSELDVVDLCNKPSKQLYQDKAWCELFLYVKYLMMLSFQNRLNVEINLPSLMHMVTLLVGRGDVHLRSAIYALSVNMIHSMAESVVVDREERNRLIGTCNQLDHHMLNLYMGSSSNKCDPFVTVNSNSVPIAAIEVCDYESLCVFLIQTVSIVKNKSDAWINEWMQLCKKVMDNNSAKVTLFCNSLIPYGHMSSCHEAAACAVDIIPFIMDFMSHHLNDENVFMSCMLSVTVLIKDKDPSQLSPSLLQMMDKLYLISILTLQIVNHKEMHVAIDLIIVLLDNMYQCRAFDPYRSLAHHFHSKYSSVQDAGDDVVQQFEAAVGLSFTQHFSFVIAILVQRALVMTETRSSAIALVKQFLVISNKMEYSTSDSLGFITALIPFERQYNTTLYCEYLFQKAHFEHERGELAFLFQKYLFHIVSDLVTNVEKLNVYKTIQRGLELLRSHFNEVFKDYHSLTHVVKVYTSADESVVEAALSLFKTMSNGMGSSSKSLNMVEPFEDCKMKGFRQYNRFDKVDKDVQVKTKVSRIIVDYIGKHFVTSASSAGAGSRSIKGRRNVLTPSSSPSSCHAKVQSISVLNKLD
ncbi:Ras GTPase activating protein [Acrasis kona]|uniref:Ras GTPase activating protein n=1 Tax=Acrasis kona TaxID=1008807 RepID=A0AAW2YJS8_9EUKA